jgi:hypothetical protein
MASVEWAAEHLLPRFPDENADAYIVGTCRERIEGMMRVYADKKASRKKR